MSAVTVTQYLSWTRSQHVALFTQKFPKAMLNKIVNAFQGKLEAMVNYPRGCAPQYIVSTTKLVRVGIDLTAAVHLVQFEPEWNERDHAQAQKRINCISQTSETHTYAMHT